MKEDDHEPGIQRANEWLRSIQNPDGGWGENCASYDNDIYKAAPKVFYLSRFPSTCIASQYMTGMAVSSYIGSS